MNKNVRPYKQRGDTCAIVCMMMVLEYYKIMEKSNWYDERRYHKIYRSQYMAGTPFSALAYHFSKNGLNATIYHSDKYLFNNDKGILDDEIFKCAMEEYKEYLNKAKLKGTKIINGVDISSQLLKEKIGEGNLIILAGEILGRYHAILLCGYQDNCFIVCDPLYKNKQIRTEAEIDRFMNTSIGKWFIEVNDKKE